MQTQTDAPSPRRSAAHLKAPPRKPVAKTTLPSRISAASLTVPGKRSGAAPLPLPAAETLSDRLYDLDVAVAGANTNERVIVLIIACIGEGLNTKKAIIGAIREYGYNPRHIAKMLDVDAGPNSARHRWQLDQNGVYSLFE